MSRSHLLQPRSIKALKYWMYETSGELTLAVQSYLTGQELTVRELNLMRAYLRQWAYSPVWDQDPHAGDGGRQWLSEMRERVRSIASRDDLYQCLRIMQVRGMDPL